MAKSRAVYVIKAYNKAKKDYVLQTQTLSLASAKAYCKKHSKNKTFIILKMQEMGKYHDNKFIG